MMQSSSLPRIAPFFRDTALQVVMLGDGADIPDAETWHQTGIRLVEEMRARLVDAGWPTAVIEQISYAQCALLDESALNRAMRVGSSVRDVWEADPLQVRFFGNYNAGEILYERMAVLLRQPAPDAALLETYLIILRLGFLGRFASAQDTQRKALLQALENALPDVGLPELYVEEGKTGWWHWFRALGPCWWALIALCVVAVLWSVLDRQLDALALGVAQIKAYP